MSYNISSEFIGILRAEVDKNEDSQLINQMIETHSGLKYEDVIGSLLAIKNELSK